MKLDPLLNRRVIFKLHGMDPLDSTILKQDEPGYWIRGGILPAHFEQSTCPHTRDNVRDLRGHIDNRQFNSYS
jgi:hypothetical protein